MSQPPLDRFSGHADLYAQYRIAYPAELYTYLLTRVEGKEAAWDCGTGNGQVAIDLSNFFTRVEATDISTAQLQNALQGKNIRYSISPAEHTLFENDTFDLITVAQALHWFDADAFHQEACRVAKPNALIAEWGYGLLRVNGEVNPIIDHFYTGIVGPYWDANRSHIDDRFSRIAFPFADIELANFSIGLDWEVERFINYLRTWSSVQKYYQQNKRDPLLALNEPLKKAWGTKKQSVEFPVFVRTGRIVKPKA